MSVTLHSCFRTFLCTKCLNHNVWCRKKASQNRFISNLYIFSKGLCTSAPQSETLQNKPSGDGGESRSIDPTGILQARLMYFDSHQLILRLKHAGFTEEQAVTIKEVFADVLQTSLEHQSKNMATKSQLEITVQQLMSHINSVKKDMVILEKSEFSQLKNETEKQAIELAHLQTSIRNDMDQLKGNVRLDINLERSRATEAHAQNEKNLQLLHNKIDTETANLRTLYEKNKNDSIKYAAGFGVGLGTLVLGVMRLMS